MKDLKTFFENPFATRDITAERKIVFGKDGLERFGVQNVGDRFGPEIATMTEAQDLLTGKSTGVMTQVSQRESLTMDTDEAMEVFTKRVTKFNRTLVAGEIDKQSVYQQFFPQGVEEFTKLVRKENIVPKMEFFIQAIKNNLSVAGGAIVQKEFEDIQANYLNARSGQLVKKGTTEDTRSQRDEAEALWNNAFFNGLLAAAKAYPNQPEKLSLFFDQSLLRTPKNSPHDGKGRLSGTITYKTGEAIEGAIIHIVDGDINNTSTNALGKYATQFVKVGEYTVVISLNNKKLYQGIVNIVDNGDTTLNVEVES